MLVLALPRQLGRGVMSVPSHAGDGAVEARCRCRVMLAMMLLRQHGHDVMSLLTTMLT
jgi:hypothetical protein